ncbi:MAG: phosphotransferase system enzyme I (PtsI) [Planctomycetota bacterium]|jgi:phosphotransferase system enzyme I (PtsI)
MIENTSSTDITEETSPARSLGFELRGTPITPGLALGVVHRKDYDLARANLRRVPVDGIEQELNRFHASLRESKTQLDGLKEDLKGRVPAEHIRVLDTHAAYLRDSVFLSDVENLILNEQMSLEAAIAKVISDFDRIFRLVENELLRERAVDLRDVGIRVLRNLEPHEPTGSELPPKNYILIARELSIVDMFQLDGQQVLGIATEEGGLTSHAAILARSMGVPMVTGIEGLRDRVQEGDFVIVDATEGALRVNPDEVVRAQYREARASGEDKGTGRLEIWSSDSFKTADGHALRLWASCGNLPEVEQAIASGLPGIGLYRTELLYLIDSVEPSLDSLVAHYSAVLAEAAGGTVTFRLLDVSSSFGINYMYDSGETNPALGRAGVRALIGRSNVLRRQLEAILRVAVDGTLVRIVVPFVTDVSELRRVREALFDVRSDLQRAGHRLSSSLELGAVIETPAAALGIRSVLTEVDFVYLNYDALAQFLLASDRDNHLLAEVFATPHPTVLRVVGEVVAAAASAEKSLVVFGPGAMRPNVLPLLIAAGVGELCVSPIVIADVERMLASIDLGRAKLALPKVLDATCQADILPILDRFVRDYDELVNDSD